MAKKQPAPVAAPVETITAFKGFDKNLQCRGMQYTIGEMFVHTGEVEACHGGLHSCEAPLDVFNYYPPASSRFAVVKAAGKISREAGGDSKIASAQLTIEAEIGIPTLVSHAIAWVMSHVDKTLEQSNTGYQSAASNTGNRSAASNTGYQSAASNTGYQSAASNTGDQSAASNTGNRSAASNTGYQSAASNTGYQSAAEVSGQHSVAASLGIQGKARAAEGGAIVLCHRDENTGALLAIRASRVGENGVKADTWYQLSADGEFVEA